MQLHHSLPHLFKKNGFIPLFCVLVFFAAALPQDLVEISAGQKKEVHSLYYQGEFQKVLELMDFFISSGQSLSRDDSAFVYKYQGVIYASDPEQVIKGEGLLFTMVGLNPEEDMRAMHLSAELEQLFIRTRERYLNEHPDVKAALKAREAMSLQEEINAKNPPPPEENAHTERVKRNWLWWTAGGTAAAIVGFTAYRYMSVEESLSPPRVDRVTLD